MLKRRTYDLVDEFQGATLEKRNILNIFHVQSLRYLQQANAFLINYKTDKKLYKSLKT